MTSRGTRVCPPQYFYFNACIALNGQTPADSWLWPWISMGSIPFWLRPIIVETCQCHGTALVDATHSAKCLSAFLIFPASLPLTAPSVIIPVTPIQTRKLLSPNITNLSYTSSKNKRLPLLRHSLALHPPCEPGEPSACGLQTQPAGQPMNWALSLIRHLELLGKYLPTPQVKITGAYP